MAPRAARTPKPQIESLPAVVAPLTTSGAAGASIGSFMDGTDGKLRTTWARQQSGPMGYGWNAMSNSPMPIMGGSRTARESSLASAVATDLVTKNPTLATIVEVLVVNILGPAGLTLSAKPSAALLGISPEAARALSTAIEIGWNAWANNPRECDLSGRNDVHSQAGTFLRHCLLNGEGLATMDWLRCRDAKTRTKVCVLDPRQLDLSQTKTVEGGSAMQGVVFDKNGRVQGYMLTQMPLGSFTATNQAKYVEAATSWGRTRVLHCFESIDARQVRGLSPLVAALTSANEKESLTEFTLMNALVQTGIAMTVESSLPAQVALAGLETPEMQAGSMNQFLKAREEFYGGTKITCAPGVVNHMPPGDSLKVNRAENTGGAFAPFNEALSRTAARASGAQAEDVSGDYSKVNYSASRMAQEMPFRQALKRRRAYVERFYQTVFSCWLDEAIETGAVPLPEGAPDYFENRAAYQNAVWRGLGRMEPDRKKAAEADALDLENNLSTFESKLAERGIDMDQHIEALVAERKLMKAAGLDRPFYPGSTTTQNRIEEITEDDSQQTGAVK